MMLHMVVSCFFCAMLLTTTKDARIWQYSARIFQQELVALARVRWDGWVDGGGVVQDALLSKNSCPLAPSLLLDILQMLTQIKMSSLKNHTDSQASEYLTMR